ncbi:MAG TPA: ATP-binding protein, partial [Luteolibacter sp.]|nr:ATP-binding protein [Luteolibacter sp.]
QCAMGMPVDVTASSATLGYLSDRFKMTYADRPKGTGDKWCVVDLGEPQVIEQVQMLPIESEHYEVVGGRGFPRKFRLQFLNDQEGREVVWETSRGSMPLGYPSSGPISLTVPSVKARYVKLWIDDMWSRDDWQVWGLAEMQIYGNNRNLAAGKKVLVSDQADKPANSGWSPEALVDGFTSRHRVLEWPQYLDRMHRRVELARELDALLRAHQVGLHFGRRVISGSVVGLLLGLVLACVWVFAWQRQSRQRELEQLRQQISRDLHDDIGSNLGGIALLSEIGSQQCPDAAWRKDFASIREAAEQASISMRDIVWLVQREAAGLKDMVRRMRDAADMILRLHEVEFSLEPTLFKDRHLTLSFRRHVFFSFKEALNNVRKHAGAKRVRVSILLDGERLRFEIQDDGKGIGAVHAADGGHGLNNLERRATQLGGSFRIDSRPGEGTLLVFEAPFHH